MGIPFLDKSDILNFSNMKTFELKRPLGRIPQNVVIPFKKVLFKYTWLIFDPVCMSDTITFSPDGRFTKSMAGKVLNGYWKYQGGDAFQLKMEGASYGMHLVHLDSNLVLFELHNTKQYYILVSPNANVQYSFGSLDSIEYYIQKLKDMVDDSRMQPRRVNGLAGHVVPIIVMGALCDSLFWHHEPDWNAGDDHRVHRDVEEDNSRADVDDREDELYDELDGEFDELDGEFDELDGEFDELDDDFDLDESDNDFDESSGQFDDEFSEDVDDDGVEYMEPVNEEPLYDNGYDDYGGLTEEEVIYDYLEDQDEL